MSKRMQFVLCFFVLFVAVATAQKSVSAQESGSCCPDTLSLQCCHHVGGMVFDISDIFSNGYVSESVATAVYDFVNTYMYNYLNSIVDIVVLTEEETVKLINNDPALAEMFARMVGDVPMHYGGRRTVTCGLGMYGTRVHFLGSPTIVRTLAVCRTQEIAHLTYCRGCDTVIGGNIWTVTLSHEWSTIYDNIGTGRRVDFCWGCGLFLELFVAR